MLRNAILIITLLLVSAPASFAAAPPEKTLAQFQGHLQKAQQNLTSDRNEAVSQIGKASAILEDLRNGARPRYRKVLKASVRDLDRLSREIENSDTDKKGEFNAAAKRAESALRQTLGLAAPQTPRTKRPFF